MLKVKLWAAAALLLACGRVPQTHYFIIDVPAPAKVTTGKQITLWLKSVSGDAIRSQDRLLYRTSEVEVHFDPYRRWALPPTDMIRQQVLDYCRQAALFRQVTEEVPEAGTAVWSASVIIRRFEEVVTPEGRIALVAMRWQVYEGVSAKEIWAGDVHAQAAIRGAEAGAIVRAISEATEKCLQQALQRLQSL